MRVGALFSVTVSLDCSERLKLRTVASIVADLPVHPSVDRQAVGVVESAPQKQDLQTMRNANKP